MTDKATVDLRIKSLVKKANSYELITEDEVKSLLLEVVREEKCQHEYRIIPNNEGQFIQRFYCVHCLRLVDVNNPVISGYLRYPEIEEISNQEKANLRK